MNHGEAREKAKMLAYILVEEFDAKQVKVAEVLNVSGPTISLWMKEMRLRKENFDLQKQVNELRVIAKGMVESGQIELNNSFQLNHWTR